MELKLDAIRHNTSVKMINKIPTPLRELALGILLILSCC